MSKGGDWERKVCKFLSVWLIGKERPYQYWRMPGSGSIGTIHEDCVDMTGDIRSLTEEARFLTDIFNIECKTGYKEASFDKHLKYNKIDYIKEHWEQCIKDSKKGNKYPMLIFRKKGFKNPWLGINEDVFLKLKNNLSNLRFIHLNWINITPCYFFEFYQFFENIKPDIVKNIGEK
jgi:hypothetical protein